MPLYNEKIMKIDREYNIIENIVNRIKELDPCDYHHNFPNKDDRDKIYDYYYIIPEECT